MTITNDIVNKVFYEKIFPELKEYLETNSVYQPLVTDYKPTSSNQFPIVPIKLLPSQNTYGNLSYSEETFSLGIEIDINSIDQTIGETLISKRKICEEITQWVIKYFKENYRVILYVEPNATTTDDSVYRTLIRVSGSISTVYGTDMDKLKIYPK